MFGVAQNGVIMPAGKCFGEAVWRWSYPNAASIPDTIFFRSAAQMHRFCLSMIVYVALLYP